MSPIQSLLHLLEKFQWQPPVISRKTIAYIAGLSPAKGDRYLVTDGPDAKSIIY